MFRLFRYARPYWYLVLLGPLLMLLEVSSELIQPRLMATIVDQGIAKGDLPLIFRTGGIMLLVAAVGMLFGVAMIVVTSIASQRYGADLRAAVFGKVLSLPTADLDKFGTGALVTRMTADVTQMQQLSMIMMRMIIRAPMLCFGSILMATSMSPELSRVFWVAVPALFLIMWVIQSKGFPLFRKAQQRLDRVNTVLQENLAGVRVIRAFGRRDYEIGRFGKANSALEDSGVHAMRFMGLMDPLMALGMNLTIVMVIWLGGRMINLPAPAAASTLTVGKLMAFIAYTSQVLFALIRNGVLVNALARSRASAARINQVMDVKPSLVTPGSPAAAAVAEGRVEFADVSFRYPAAGGEPVLQHVSFVAEPGTTTAIIGSTGSGKSTLVSLIPRLYDVLDGAVLIDGVDVREYDLAGLRAAIGMVMQDTVLFSGQIQDNLRWGSPGATPDEMQEAAAAAQADDFVSRLPDGYASAIGQRGTSLSGGQKQRLSIARALVRRPKILILDDSTSSVDMGTEARIQQALREKAWPCTTIIIAQRVSSVIDADKIVVLENGQVNGIGTHQELLRSNVVYREIVGSQFGQEAIADA